MNPAEALAWLAGRLVWEDRLAELERGGGEPTTLVGMTTRTGRDPRRPHVGRTPVARAS